MKFQQWLFKLLRKQNIVDKGIDRGMDRWTDNVKTASPPLNPSLNTYTDVYIVLDLNVGKIFIYTHTLCVLSK